MAYNCFVRFEWDLLKNSKIFKKHGIWFEEAQTVWVDASSIEFYDLEHSKSEDRYFRISCSALPRLLVVIFCERSNGNEIRIFSARRATMKERKQYEKGI